MSSHILPRPALAESSYALLRLGGVREGHHADAWNVPDEGDGALQDLRPRGKTQYSARVQIGYKYGRPQ